MRSFGRRESGLECQLSRKSKTKEMVSIGDELQRLCLRSDVVTEVDALVPDEVLNLRGAKS